MTSVAFMRNPKLVTLLFCGATLHASVASAQACLGLPSFTVRPVHVVLAGEFPDSATSYAAGIGAGRHNRLFANLGAGQVSYQGYVEKATFGFLEFGVQFPVGMAQLCPIAGGYLASGPDDAAGPIKRTSRSAAAGGAIGLPLDVGFVELIPRAAVTYDYLSQKVDAEGFDSATETFNSGVVDVGLGFVFRDRFSVQPVVHMPFAGEDDKVSFGVFASASFGWPLGGFASRTPQKDAKRDG
ncbi:MAG: hypothetical protein EXR92_03095 [Gemmatimonadetes bacterium]|nr:hypothetical protein [Gemmatimonadota bacterium]